MHRRMLCAAVLLGLAWLARDAAAAEPRLIVDVQISTTELKCDGDSARLSIRAVYGDGSPGAGLKVNLYMAGSITIPGIGTFDQNVVAYTDRHGRLDVRLMPAPGTRNYADWSIWIDDAWYRGDAVPYGSNSSPHIACPFGRDGESSTLALHFWQDDDGDGRIDAGERPLRNADVELIYGCHHCAIVGHHQRTDARGATVWENIWPLPVDYDGVPPGWSFCLSEKFEIRSVNGAPASTDSCYRLSRLGSGLTELQIGVQQVNLGPPAIIIPGPPGIGCDSGLLTGVAVIVRDGNEQPVTDGTRVRFSFDADVLLPLGSTTVTQDSLAVMYLVAPPGIEGIWVEARAGAAFARWFEPCR